MTPRAGSPVKRYVATWLSRGRSAASRFSYSGIFNINGPVWFVVIALTFATDLLLFAATHRVASQPTQHLMSASKRCGIAHTMPPIPPSRTL